MPFNPRLPRIRSAAIMVGLVAAAACRPEPETEAPQNVQTSKALPVPPLPVAEAPVDRAALLQALERAASAAALGRSAPAEQRNLDGKLFEFRIRFGCPVDAAGEESKNSPFSVRYDEKGRTLRLRATPDLAKSDALLGEEAGTRIEEVEGFWLPRPWILADGCPVAPPTVQDTGPAEDDPKGGQTAASRAAEPAAAPRSTHFGLAQYYGETDSRLGRRDKRGYQATKRLAADEQPSSEGYVLVLSGRLQKSPSGDVISCRVSDADRPPDCIASVRLDRVRIENPTTQDIVAEWGS